MQSAVQPQAVWSRSGHVDLSARSTVRSTQHVCEGTEIDFHC